MDESCGYRYNPSYVPQPKFVPGYGGYLPGVLNKYRVTYGNASHQILRKKTEVAGRLASIQPPSKKDSKNPLACSCKQDVEYHKGGIISDKETMFIPEYVCPGYTGCLTLKKKGLPTNSCCHKVLRSLGCDQCPYDIPEELIEDPFPGPPRQVIDYTQEKRRCQDGLWKRYPKDYTVKSLYKWM